MERFIVGLCFTLSFGVIAEDLEVSAIDSLLQQTIQEQAARPTVQESTESPTANSETSSEVPPKTNGKRTAAEILSIPVDGSPTVYNQKLTALQAVLKRTDDPNALLNALIAEGTLQLSPNDIFLLRLAIDEIERAKNQNFVNPTLINDEYMVDYRDRYKTYDLFVHDTGETLLEFLDINGEPWPIFDKSESDDLNIRQGEDHMLWISPNTKYRQLNLFVTLQGYKNPIQFIVKYSNDKRHGLTTFKIPTVSPTSTLAKTTKSQGNVTLSSLSNTVESANSDFAPEGLSYEDLTYLASTGRFREESELNASAVNVLVSDPSIAQVWFVRDRFVVRTPYFLYGFDDIINAGGAMRVFVTSRLNSVVPMNTGSGQVNLYIPNYHNYVRR